ncbi:MAG: AarF/ABC1/UbiB kinase family protein, partial [Bdellovibrionales bacterium]|nr:AarF/ABC1/UbiB kinase family protein [Bdellovibrionales bacterium]
RHLQKKPLGVGSIGQVHRAKTIDGDRVVLKILRPNTREKLKADFEFMEWILARVKSLRLNSESLFFVEKILFDLKNSMEKEANLLLEKNSILRFQKKYNRSQRFYVPKVYDELCTSQVLVMEEIKGESLAQLRKSRLIGKKRKREIAEQVLKEVMTQILVDGDFHADPHAGNSYLMEDGRVAFIDLGLTGQFTGEDRKKLSKAIQALLDRNPEKVFDALLGFGEVSNDFDREKFKKEVSEIVKANRKGVQDYASGGEGVSLESFVDELFQAAFRNGVYVPSDTTLLIKTLITVEGVARSLHPQLNLVKSTVPVVMTAIMPKWLRWPLGKR